MAHALPVERDDAYEGIAATYQMIEIARLNEILKRYDISDEARRQICAEYIDNSGVFLDCGWLTVDRKRVWPTLCFAERPLHPTEGLGEITKLYVPTQLFSFHEYASGNLFAYFDELRESVESIEHGNL